MARECKTNLIFRSFILEPSESILLVTEIEIEIHSTNIINWEKSLNAGDC